MNQPSTLEKLHQAVKAEKLAGALRAERYQLLTAKMKAYQEGGEVAPTVDEFVYWRSCVEERIALKKLQVAFACSESLIEVGG